MGAGCQCRVGVAGGQVGVEDALVEDLPEHRAQQHVRGTAPDIDRQFRDQRPGARQRHSVEALHHDDPFGAQLVVDVWDAHPVCPQPVAQRGHVVDLGVVVQFLADGGSC